MTSHGRAEKDGHPLGMPPKCSSATTSTTCCRVYLNPMNVIAPNFRKVQFRTMIATFIVVAAMASQDTALASAYPHSRDWLGIAAPPLHTSFELTICRPITRPFSIRNITI